MFCSAVLSSFLHPCVHSPQGIAFTLRLFAYKTDDVRFMEYFANHPKALRSSKWANTSFDRGDPSLLTIGFDRLHEIVPIGVGRQVREDDADLLGRSRNLEFAGVLHPVSVPGSYAQLVRFVFDPADEGCDWLADLDLIALGARTGLLWRDEQTIVVGLGETTQITMSRPHGAKEAHEAFVAMSEPVHSHGRATAESHPHVALTAIEFNPVSNGTLHVPQIVVAEKRQGAQRTRWLSVLSEGPDSHDRRAQSCAYARSLIHVAATDVLPPPKPHSVVTVSSDVDAATWMGTVAAATESIRTGTLEKVVLARELRVTTTDTFLLPRIVEDLARRFPAAMLFSIDGFVGVSPELLAARSGRELKSHPLAGTLPRHADDTEADIAAATQTLLDSSKDRHEHGITIRWLLDELLPFCSYVDAEPQPSVMELANVYHLGTLVAGVLTDPPVSVLELVNAVHPTPAVGGSPQGQAVEMINEVEGFDRQRYAGPTGWVDTNGDGAFAVAVRTAQIRGGRATVWAGVGVVEESDPHAELAETQAKFQAILPTLLHRAVIVEP